MSMFDDVERLKSVQEQIADAALSAGRNPGEISMIAVSKMQTLEQMRHLVAIGITAFGESRIQEALPKIETFKSRPDIHFHFIGNLQTNKAKAAVGMFDLIHSVDRIPLVQQMQLHAKNAGCIQDVLIQVNLAKEEQKGGVYIEELDLLVDAVRESSNIRLRGFMMVPPWHENPEKNRELFRNMRKLFDKYSGNEHINILSMGMSDDYKVAIQEGATLVRIGTALFGARTG